MKAVILCLALAWASTIVAAEAPADQPNPGSPAPVTQATIDKLLAVIAAHEARIDELERKLGDAGSGVTETPPPRPAIASISPPVAAAVVAPELPAAVPVVPAQPVQDHDIMMTIPGGPQLHIRGFADYNLGFGQDANPLIFPLGRPAHTSFEIGEIDLYITSQLSKKISFLGEFVIGSDETNTFGWDIERFQLTYKHNPYFQITGGRFHTSIGYYNTTFHHGTWFQTTTGRPFMYFFEDSGGMLPVHTVGISTTGLLPHTGKFNLHWVAEGGNGRASNPALDPVQSFLADRNHKAFNAAIYIQPEWVPGLQMGGSFYLDKLYPPGESGVAQTIASAHIVYNNSAWEIMDEAVLVTNKVSGTDLVYHTPLMYTQVSRAFGRYRPYFRYQYVNSPNDDPVNIFTGRYMGPSAGLRMDFTNYVALKVQYNRLYQRVPAWNGLDLQAAFTF
jgi:hypothetical protein